LPTFGGDHTDRGDPDLLVDAMILIDGSRLRTPTNCQVMPRNGGNPFFSRDPPRFPEAPQHSLLSTHPAGWNRRRSDCPTRRPNPVLEALEAWIRLERVGNPIPWYFALCPTLATGPRRPSTGARNGIETSRRTRRDGNRRVFHGVTGGVKR
jgi:hypothetical protein